jgi:hypothetical protein
MTDFELDAEDALCLRIGRVARAHTNLDNTLRRVHQTLVSPGLGVYLTSRVSSTNSLVHDCRTMLAKAGLDPDVHAAAQGALVAAKEANELRNRVVHDMWMREPEADQQEQPKWTTFRTIKWGMGAEASDPPRDLAFLDHAVDRLARTNLRVSGLVWALWEVLPYFQGRMGALPQDEGHDPDTVGNLSAWVALMEDRFDMEGSEFRPHPPQDQ